MSDAIIGGIILVCLFLVIIGIPCVGIAIVGRQLIYKLSHFPSKTPAIQTGILFKLVIIEIVGFTLLLTFYHILSDYGSETERVMKESNL